MNRIFHKFPQLHVLLNISRIISSSSPPSLASLWLIIYLFSSFCPSPKDSFSVTNGQPSLDNSQTCKRYPLSLSPHYHLEHPIHVFMLPNISPLVLLTIVFSYIRRTIFSLMSKFIKNKTKK